MNNIVSNRILIVLVAYSKDSNDCAHNNYYEKVTNMNVDIVPTTAAWLNSNFLRFFDTLLEVVESYCHK